MGSRQDKSIGDCGRLMTLLLCLLLTSLLLSCHATHPDPREKDMLSDIEHGDDEHHNSDYDHEAFLGKEEAKKYSELTPLESKQKLATLFDQVDAQVTTDGYVTDEELRMWLHVVQDMYMRGEADRVMKQNDENNDGFVTWEEYKNNTYGGVQEENESEMEGHAKRVSRDEQYFKLADRAGDNMLDMAEFSAFFHPGNHEHMQGIIVNETLQDLDKDKDGFVTLEEYLGDYWPGENHGGEEPDWLKAEKEQFIELRDMNKDGKMDSAEVKAWILPEEQEHVLAEAKHLLLESDADKDGKISKEEMVEKYDLFVGSQATDYGEILKRHDEL